VQGWRLLLKALSAASLLPFVYAFRHRSKSTAFEQAPAKGWHFARTSCADTAMQSKEDSAKPGVAMAAFAEPMVRIHLPPGERCYGAGGEDGNFVAYIN
jgi:hypothetical protein